jgi:hypothetical protein
MVEKRKQAMQQPGVHLDQSPTGSGKTHADAEVLKAADGRRSLTLLANHAQCTEAIQMRASQQMTSVSYPRLDATTCRRFDEAKMVSVAGLSPAAALCPSCEYRSYCLYRMKLVQARETQHAVATHQRLATSPDMLIDRREVIILHEQAIDALRPTVTTRKGLKIVALVAETADENAEDPKDRGFYRHLARIAQWLHVELHAPEDSRDLDLPKPARHVPEDHHEALFAAVRSLGCHFPADAMKLVLTVATGNLESLHVSVEERPAGKGKVCLRWSLHGTLKTPLPFDCSTTICDATTDVDQAAAALGQPVMDITPRGTLPRLHEIVQIIPSRGKADLDITRARKVESVASVLRGIIHDLPQYKQFGLITHSTLLNPKEGPGLISKLGDDGSRIAMSDYFGGSHTRGSNLWHRTCDCLLILGTPRLSWSSIAQRLRQTRRYESARLTPNEVHWSRTYGRVYNTRKDGNRFVIISGYSNAAWQWAYQSCTLSELRQCIGRARSCLENGIPVYVVTLEDLCDPTILVHDHPFPPLTEAAARVLAVLEKAGAKAIGSYERPLIENYSLSRGLLQDGAKATGPYEGPLIGTYSLSMTARQIARQIGLNRARVTVLLKRLEADGRVRHISQRGGWLAVENPADAAPVWWDPSPSRYEHELEKLMPWYCRSVSAGTEKNRRKREKAKERKAARREQFRH